jgi:hypothetical protein
MRFTACPCTCLNMILHELYDLTSTSGGEDMFLLVLYLIKATVQCMYMLSLRCP